MTSRSGGSLDLPVHSTSARDIAALQAELDTVQAQLSILQQTLRHHRTQALKMCRNLKFATRLGAPILRGLDEDFVDKIRLHYIPIHALFDSTGADAGGLARDCSAPSSTGEGLVNSSSAGDQGGGSGDGTDEKDDADDITSMSIAAARTLRNPWPDNEDVDSYTRRLLSALRQADPSRLNAQVDAVFKLMQTREFVRRALRERVEERPDNFALAALKEQYQTMDHRQTLMKVRKRLLQRRLTNLLVDQHFFMDTYSSSESSDSDDNDDDDNDDDNDDNTLLESGDRSSTGNGVPSVDASVAAAAAERKLLHEQKLKQRRRQGARAWWPVASPWSDNAPCVSSLSSPARITVGSSSRRGNEEVEDEVAKEGEEEEREKKKENGVSVVSDEDVRASLSVLVDAYSHSIRAHTCEHYSVVASCRDSGGPATDPVPLMDAADEFIGSYTTARNSMFVSSDDAALDLCDVLLVHSAQQLRALALRHGVVQETPNERHHRQHKASRLNHALERHRTLQQQQQQQHSSSPSHTKQAKRRSFFSRQPKDVSPSVSLPSSSHRLPSYSSTSSSLSPRARPLSLETGDELDRTTSNV